MPNPFKILDFVTIRNKKDITDNNGDTILDISETVIEEKNRLEYSDAPVQVSEELAGRPVAISKIKYDDGSLADLLCHHNDISNPFMIPEGYIMYIPSVDSMVSNVVDRNNEKTKNKSKDNLNKKLTQKDKKRVQSLMAKAKANGANVADTIATPNMADENIPDILAVGGEIILGNNVTNTRCSRELSTTQTKTEAIKKAIKIDLLANNSIASQ